MKKILVTSALVAGVFFSGCTTSLTQAYSNTVNSINETAREINAKNEEKRNKNNKSINTNDKYEALSEDGDTRFGTVY